MTLADVIAEIGNLTKTRGALIHEGASLKGLVGRALVDFVSRVRCNHYHDLRTTVTAASGGVVDLTALAWTLGSGGASVKAIDLNEIRMVTGNTLLEKVDTPTIMRLDLDWLVATASTSTYWLHSSVNRIHFVPPPSSDMAVRASGAHHARAITSASADDAVIDVPPDAEQAFIYFATWQALLSVSDGNTAEFSAQLGRRAMGMMDSLLGKYRVGPLPFGYTPTGDVVTV